MGVSFLYHTALDPGLEAGRTERRSAYPGRIEVLQVSRPTVNADNTPGPRGTQRPILGPPCAQQDGLLVAHQLQLRPALNVRSPVLLGPVDPVQRGPFREVVLEGLDVGVIGGHGLQFYTPFSVWERGRWGRGVQPCCSIPLLADESQLHGR